MPVYELSPQLNFFADTTYVTHSGCDSTICLQLDVHPSYDVVAPGDTTYVHICEDRTYQFYDSIYNAHGEWQHGDGVIRRYTLDYIDQTQEGCDSLVAHVVYVHPTYTVVTNDTICQSLGGTYRWEGHSLVYSRTLGKRVASISLDQSGHFVYVDSLKTMTCLTCSPEGCDSVFVLNLLVLPSYNIVDEVVKMSEEETFTWHENGVTYGGVKALSYDSLVSVQYPDTFVVHKVYQTTPVGSHVCDSIRTLKIVIGPVVRDTTYDEVCSNESYYWYGKNQHGGDSIRRKIEVPRDSIYVDAYTTSLGFDSIFYLNLTVHPSYVNVPSMTVSVSTCQYSSYEWSRSGSPVSTRLYSLTEGRWIPSHAIPTEVVGDFVYVDSLQTIHGCDSVWKLHLTILPEYVDTVYRTMCDNDFLIWENRIYKGDKFKGVLPNDTMPVFVLPSQLNFYADTTYKTQTGCDSVIYLHLDIHPTYIRTESLTTCDDVNPYIWTTQDRWGTYHDTIYYTPQSIYTDPITNKPTKDVMDIVDKSRTLHTIQGCDSVVNLHLTVYPTYLFLTEDTICSGEYYEWRGHKKYWYGNGTVISKDSYHTIDGCDSVYQFNLYLKPRNVTHRFENICDNNTLYHDKDVVWAPGMSVTDTLKDVMFTNMYGCDSIVRYHLTIHPTYKFGEDQNYTICSTESFKLHDSMVFTPQVKFYELGSILAPIDTLITDTLKSSTCPNCPDAGCDSIFIAQLKILPAYKHLEYDTICSNEYLMWHGKICENSMGGDYVYHDSLLTIWGCDSIYELHLHVKQSYEIFLPSETICADDSLLFAGRYINKSGIYRDTLTTVEYCDSILSLQLTVYDTTCFVIHDTICVTEKYVLDTLYSSNLIFTEPGYYVDTTLNEWGCKHHTYLYLEMIDTTKYTLELGDICADEENILIYYTYSGRPLIEYSVLFDSLGVAQGFENIYHAPLDQNASVLQIPMPKGDVLPHPEPTYFDSQCAVNKYIDDDKYAYPHPGRYKITVIMHNGICGDTLQVKDTVLNIRYPSWIHEQHWNDGIVLYNETYNGGYTFSHYQWYQNGEPIIGATKEYLYLPDRLWLNERDSCNNYYQVLLTNAEDGTSAFTCPICPILLSKDTIVPRLDYFSIVPTIVVSANPVVHILSTMRLTTSMTIMCSVYNAEGQLVAKPWEIMLEPNEHNYAGRIELPKGLPASQYIVRLTTENGEMRSFTILIKL